MYQPNAKKLMTERLKYSQNARVIAFCVSLLFI